MARLHTVFFIQLAKNSQQKKARARVSHYKKLVSVFVSDLAKQNMCQVIYCQDTGGHHTEIIEIKIDIALGTEYFERGCCLTCQEFPDMSGVLNNS